MTMNLMNKVKAAFPSVTGALNVQDIDGTVFISGRVSGEAKVKEEIERLVSDEYPTSLIVNTLQVDSGLSLVVNESTSLSYDKVLDEVKVLFSGEVPLSAIRPNTKYTDKSNENLDRLLNVYDVMNFATPILVDATMKIIDGQVRYDLLRERNATRAYVIVTDAVGARADFLRLALNRSSEFQRWNYSEVDSFIDSIPQCQPLFEPLGFFGNTIMPESFFSGSMLSYRIDKFNSQQSQYSQEQTIEDWALLREREIREAHELAKKKRKEKVIPTFSLFDFLPDEDEVTTTESTARELTADFKANFAPLAEEITSIYDEKRKAEMEEKGIKWQNSRRNPGEVAMAAREEYRERISKLEVSEEVRLSLLSDLDGDTPVAELEKRIKTIELEEEAM